MFTIKVVRWVRHGLPCAYLMLHDIMALEKLSKVFPHCICILEAMRSVMEAMFTEANTSSCLWYDQVQPSSSSFGTMVSCSASCSDWENSRHKIFYSIEVDQVIAFVNPYASSVVVVDSNIYYSPDLISWAWVTGRW